MLLEFFFQHPTRLNEDASIDGLVRHLQALIVQIGPLEPAGDLFRRPVQRQLAGHYIPEPAIQREPTEFRTTRAVPGGLIRPVCTITLLIGVSRDLTADGRRRTIELPGNLTQRRAGREAPRYLFALGQRERPDGAVASWRRPPAVQTQKPESRSREFTYRTANVAQRSPIPPATPNFVFLSIGHARSSQSCHTTFLQILD